MPDQSQPHQETSRWKQRQESLENALRELEEATMRLRLMGLYIVMAAFFSLGSIITSIWLRYWVSNPDSLVQWPIVTALAITAPLAGIMALFLWERRVNQGMVL